MKKKLLAYQISGQTVSVDVFSWSEIELEGNKPFLSIDDGESIPSGYTDISSIHNWSSFGWDVCCPITSNKLEVGEMGIRYQIKELLTPSQLTGSTSGLTAQEIDIVKNFKFSY